MTNFFHISKSFLPFIKSDQPRQIFYGGASSGKSYFLAQRLVLDLIAGNRNYLVVRQFKSSMKNSSFNQIRQICYNTHLAKYFSFSSSDLSITCNLNGCQAILSGMDDPEKVKSILPKNGVITDIWVEEATEISLLAFRQLEKRLRGRSSVAKRITLSFNPVSPGHWIPKTLFPTTNLSDNPYLTGDLLIHHSSFLDNPFLDKGDRKRLLSEKDNYFYQVYTLGNFAAADTLIFPNYVVKPIDIALLDSAELYCGLDFGYSSDPCAVVLISFDKSNNTIYVMDEIYATGLTNMHLFQLLRDKIPGYVKIVADSAEPKSIAELRHMGVNIAPARKGPDSIRFGIDWLKRQNIVIDPSCKNFINEISQYSWKKDSMGNVLSVPAKSPDHLIDALRYAVEELARFNPSPLRLKF